MRAFEGFLRKRFDEASPIRLNSVHSVDSFWRYFNESFQPAIYGADTARYYFPGAVVPTWLQVLGPNYLYGMGRMRVLNVQPDSGCQADHPWTTDGPSPDPSGMERVDEGTVDFGMERSTQNPIFRTRSESFESIGGGCSSTGPPARFWVGPERWHQAKPRPVTRR